MRREERRGEEKRRKKRGGAQTGQLKIQFLKIHLNSFLFFPPMRVH